MATYRVLVVDDSAFMRTIISDLIKQDEQFVIAATATNGAEAVAAAAEHKPDVITMDLEMPVLNGIEALQLIMKQTPTPVIMLSGISEDNARDTIKALQYGALDFIRKPSMSKSGDIHQVGEQLLEKLRIAVFARRSKTGTLPERQKPETAAQTDIKPEPRIKAKQKPTETPPPSATPLHKAKLEPMPEEKRKSAAPKPAEKTAKLEKRPIAASGGLSSKQPTVQPTAAQQQAVRKAPGAGTFKHIVAIGTSTGGPRALHEVICSLPSGFPAPVLVVQHMPPKFTKSLAQRLDSFSALTVVEAEQGMRVSAGVVHVAPGGKHMELGKDAAGYFIRLTDQPQRNGHRPSVDVMFESLLPFPEIEWHAVIMTGMGSDGAKGLKALSDGGAATTIAESEETCIVYGMPRAAVECGAAQHVLPLHSIAGRLASTILT
ncbi:chemotaxis-specific protein-glutamate methyltransferase CheB [Paenibacillus sp. 1011MAR3C5]|uniref:chemotaxis-specific protein-glutamate methyltransferase CheB n=1 Tax=Paenibacillus sp. 1011MAR3C5 TaxID=1675787 RepID=UPI000E6C8235|nr:chemotaxis-specific protein-glutamate methyltransferase CheB [Paenibacillus sp. 1011MAR3C5]RJE86771.1 chemotaxis-specific protein-glutamate methyltransferase CheB [Paenibacillus sp. 1011MAR3C5]